VRREILEELTAERQAHLRAVLSNGGFFQIKDGLDIRKNELERINRTFQEAIERVRDPGKEEREQRALESNPLFSAGIRGLERLKWDMFGGQDPALIQRLQKQGM
jgi:hypothetical protein